MARQLSEDLILKLYADSAEFTVGAAKASNALRGIDQQAKTTGESLNKNISERFRQAANQAGIFLGPLDGLSGRLNATATAFNSFGVGMTLLATATTAIIATAVKAINVYKDVELSMARTEAMITATGNASGFTAGELDKMARSLAMNTLASTEGVRRAQQAVMVYRNVYGEVYQRTIKLAQDAAELWGSSIEAEAKRIAQALQSPGEGMASLTRIGARFSDEQKDQIENLVNQNRLYEAQVLILDGLEARLGGIGEQVASGTIAGQIDSFGQNVSEIMEAIAKQSGVAEAFKQTLAQINRGMALTVAQLNDPQEYDALAAAQERAVKALENLAAAEAEWERVRNKDNVSDAVKSRRLGEMFAAESERKAAMEQLTAANQEIINKGIAHGEEYRKTRLESEQTQAEETAKAQRAAEKVHNEHLDKLLGQLGESNQRQEELINQRWEAREKEIDQLMITQQALERFAEMGLTNEQQVKDHLRKLNDDFFDEEFAKLQEAEQRKIDAKNRAREQELTAERRHQEQLARLGSRDEADSFRKQLEYIEGEWFPRRMALLERYKEERLTQIQTLEISEGEKNARIEKLEEDSTNAKLRLKRQTEVQGQQAIDGALVTLAQSKNRKIAGMARAAMVAQTVMKTYEGAMAAYASAAAIPYVGFILGPAAAAAVIAAGMMNVQQIRSTPMGQFHQGIDYVPTSGDYTLLAGERVLDKRLNGDLKEFINKGGNNAEVNLKVEVYTSGGENVNVRRERQHNGVTAQDVVKIFVGDMAERGPMHKALTQYTTAGNRL